MFKASSSPSFGRPSTDVSTSGVSLRVSVLRQLSKNFAQLNGALLLACSRKPLTKKSANRKLVYVVFGDHILMWY
uniref:Uncharacterized protein n=1 Tax=Nelumbo nucifera TaxID=4432 RepID=A0A822XL40_NELNU|nr:TPA_asm: hypothetical protein HUJ06_019721 [Nelumbo nucifera]